MPGFGRIPLPNGLRLLLMSCFWSTQGLRQKTMKVLTVVMLVSAFYMLFLRQRQSVAATSSEDWLSSSPHPLDDYWQAVDHNQRYEFDSLASFFPDKILVPAHRDKFIGYLKVLQHAVKIVDCLPRHLTMGVVKHCNGLGKPPLLQHQHALEIVFPKMLRDMSGGGRETPEWGFDPIFSSDINNITSVVAQPLFYYVEAYPYHAVYCTTKSNNKDPHSSREDWTRRDPYWASVAEHLVTLPEWGENQGVDFVAPASHPQLKPSRRHPHKINSLQRLSFLSTDMDVSGGPPKDIVVPYLHESFSSGQALTAPPARSGPFLYFAGGDNPKLGLRSKLAAMFAQLAVPDVVFLLNADKNDYLMQMASAQFCLIARGDTASSRRLFTAIEVGCIPVIVSDWLDLPFARFIDYSTFTIQVPEAVAGSSRRLSEALLQLRRISGETIASMHSALAQARRVLLFNHLVSAEAEAGAEAEAEAEAGAGAAERSNRGRKKAPSPPPLSRVLCSIQ